MRWTHHLARSHSLKAKTTNRNAITVIGTATQHSPQTSSCHISSAQYHSIICWSLQRLPPLLALLNTNATASKLRFVSTNMWSCWLSYVGCFGYARAALCNWAVQTKYTAIITCRVSTVCQTNFSKWRRVVCATSGSSIWSFLAIILDICVAQHTIVVGARKLCGRHLLHIWISSEINHSVNGVRAKEHTTNVDYYVVNSKTNLATLLFSNSRC